MVCHDTKNAISLAKKTDITAKANIFPTYLLRTFGTMRLYQKSMATL